MIKQEAKERSLPVSDAGMTTSGSVECQDEKDYEVCGERDSCTQEQYILHSDFLKDFWAPTANNI